MWRQYASSLAASSPAKAGDPVFQRRQRFTEPPPACWIPRLRGDDLIVSSHQAHTRILAMPNASESCKFIVPLLDRGRREGRVLAAPMVRVQQKSTRQNHRYGPNNRPSLRDGFNGLYALSPVRRAFWPPSSAAPSKRRRKFSVSVGTPGPHDFAVRPVSYTHLTLPTNREV